MIATTRCVLLLLLVCAVAFAQPKPAASTDLPDKLTNAEFARLMKDFSEPGGDFISDNLISNETAYLPVLNKLQELNATGGAYIGVGPEQNFSYIAQIHPRIAFILDIRHLAATHHLLYKALFHLSPDRAQFLSRLLSRPLAKEKPLGANASMQELLDYFSSAKPDEKFYAATLAEVCKTIAQDFQLTFSDFDQKELEYLLRSFFQDGVDIAFRLGGWRTFPSLKEILSQVDPRGKAFHFLAKPEAYEVVRQLHLKNLIIPITGNFAGAKALAAIGNYLRKNNVAVTAFYLSNVEQYLFEDGLFDSFVGNVQKLPLNENSLFIRSVLARYNHPAYTHGDLFAMLLQRIPVFLEDHKAGRYKSYYQLVTTHYIGIGQ